jgi:hypothetical protein
MRDPRISLAKTVDIFRIETVAFLFSLSLSLSLFFGVGGGRVSPHSPQTQSWEKKVIRVCGNKKCWEEAYSSSVSKILVKESISHG